jgi:hypothetical protein
MPSREADPYIRRIARARRFAQSLNDRIHMHAHRRAPSVREQRRKRILSTTSTYQANRRAAPTLAKLKASAGPSG